MPPVKSVNGLDRDFIESLNKKIAGVESRDGKLTIGSTVQSAVERALERRKARVNALEAALDAAVLRVEINAFTRREHTPKRVEVVHQPPGLLWQSRPRPLR